MAYTQQHLDDLNEAIATGVMEVEINGRRTKFRSLNEMLRTKALIEQSLQGNGSKSDRVMRTDYRRDYQ